MFRFLLLLLGTLTAGSPARRDAAGSSADGSYGMTGPGAVRTDPYGPASGTAWPGEHGAAATLAGSGGQPRRPGEL